MKIERQTLAQQVLDRLVMRLMESHLKQGERVSTEQELMEEFRVSRSSVREAVKALQNLGILESRPALGTFLSSKEDTYARLLLFASLLSKDTDRDLREISRSLELYSLFKLQRDLQKNKKEEVFQAAHLVFEKLKGLFNELKELYSSGTADSQQLEEKQSQFMLLLSAYPNEKSLLSKMCNNLDEFLLSRNNGNSHFSKSAIKAYAQLLNAVEKNDRMALVDTHAQLETSLAAEGRFFELEMA